jgi:hypothetical protein
MLPLSSLHRSGLENRGEDGQSACFGWRFMTIGIGLQTTREQESLFQHRRKPKSLIFKVFEGKD